MKIAKGICYSSIALALANFAAAVGCLIGCQVVSNKIDNAKDSLTSNINVQTAVMGEVMDNFAENKDVDQFVQDFSAARRKDSEFYVSTVSNTDNSYLSTWKDDVEEIENLQTVKENLTKAAIGTTIAAAPCLAVARASWEVKENLEDKNKRLGK